MWNWIVDFYKSHKYVILWTAGYFIATWAIMNFMFDFDILSTYRWHQLAHAHLRGFPGFVFGILILAAIPMYIATTVVIAKTKAPLFTVKIPEFIKTAFTQTPMEEDEPVDTPEKNDDVTESQDSAPVENTPAPIPESVPSEMRMAYERARDHIGRQQTSVFDLGHVTNTAVAQQEETSTPETPDMPIPTDFDLDEFDTSVPQFTDINFDDDEYDEDDDEIAQDTFKDVHELPGTVAPVAEYMESKSVPYTIDDDAVVTDKYAIVSHTDADFWVADNESWFAAGKTRPSPIELLKRIASTHNVEPVLYLGADNIMDIDTLISQWESDGIHVIKELNDLI